MRNTNKSTRAARSNKTAADKSNKSEALKVITLNAKERAAFQSASKAGRDAWNALVSAAASYASRFDSDSKPKHMDPDAVAFIVPGATSKSDTAARNNRSRAFRFLIAVRKSERNVRAAGSWSVFLSSQDNGSKGSKGAKLPKVYGKALSAARAGAMHKNAKVRAKVRAMLAEIAALVSEAAEA